MAVDSDAGTWASWVHGALNLEDRRQSAALLAEMVLAESALMLSADDPVPTRLPAGNPPKALMRTAGVALLAHAESETDQHRASVWRSLGLRARHSRPQRIGSDEDELLNAAEDARQAVQAAEVDPVLELLALQLLSIRQRNVLDLPGSLETAERMLATIREVRTSTRHYTLPALLPQATWLPDLTTLLPAFEVASHSRAAIAARFLNKIHRAVKERDQQILAAEALSSRRPSLLADALGQRAALARHRGDVRTAIDALDKQGEHVAATPASAGAQSIRCRSLATHAKFLDDWDTERESLLSRLSLELAREGDGSLAPVPSALQGALGRLHAADRGRALIALGNIAYELGRNLLDSGLAAQDHARAEECEQWLRASLYAWRDVGMNGKTAANFRLLELAAIWGTAGSPEHVGRRMVEASRAWRRPVGQRSAAIKAAKFGRPGDPLVLERLEELHQRSSQADAAHLALGLGLWHLRAGNACASPSPEAVKAWAKAAEWAELASADLTVLSPGAPPVLLDAPAYIRALQIQAEATGRLAAAVPEVDRTDELAIRMKTLPGIARRVSTARTNEQRHTVWASYVDWLADTVALAVELEDPDAADKGAEVARRDFVGMVLKSMSDSPELARLAAELTAALRAVSSGIEPDEDDRHPDEELGPQDRARGVATQLGETLDVLGAVVGPVARGLFDPEAVLLTTAQDLLASPAAGTQAVLSLWLMPHGRLMRRLLWRKQDGSTGSSLDMVPTPAYLPSLRPPTDSQGHAAFFEALPHVRDVLLPEPLLTLLREAAPEDPVALTIVPTGLMSVPFAALEIDDDHLLLDCATLTLVQSLQTAVALTAGDPPANSIPNHVASFDTNTFDFTEYELQALQSHFPATRQAHSLEDLRQLLSDPSLRGGDGILVLALEGKRGTDGWSQSKILPNGERLTTAHILQWSIPRLVVGASCHTDIRSDDAGELGGFPLAFQLRGATTVIGTLADVPDRATSQIMRHFYAYLSDGTGPAESLRLAQRAWIAADPKVRYAEKESWSYLIAYGVTDRS